MNETADVLLAVPPSGGPAVPVEGIEIPAAGALDAIVVFWRNLALGKGSVTITCWGCAWTCYFGAMGDRTIQQFFGEADTSYLVPKLGITQFLKKSRQHDAYLGRIVDAIKGALCSQQGEAHRPDGRGASNKSDSR